MRKILFVLLVGIGLWQQSKACDMCGCASGNTYMGIMPRYQKNFLGLQYFGRSFETHHLPSLLTGAAGPMSYDRYSTYQLYGRIYPLPRLQLMAFLPFNVNLLKEDGGTESVKGFGDLQLFANYIIVNTGDSIGHPFKHTWLAGGGLKAPTGKFNAQSDGEMLNPNMQPGTGTWDFILNNIYTVRYRKVGLNTSMTYRFSGTNSEGYRFGDKMNADLRFFYWRNKGKFSFLPNAGFSFEYSQKDRDKAAEQALTGGRALFASAGIELYCKKMVFVLNYQQPLEQHLSEGYVHAQPRIMASVQILFDSFYKSKDDE